MSCYSRNLGSAETKSQTQMFSYLYLCNEIQEIIYKALWNKKNNDDVYVEGRHQIAEERTHALIRVGGLNTVGNTGLKTAIVFS